MVEVPDLIGRTEKLLAQIDLAQRVLDDFKAELAEHAAALRAELAELQQAPEGGEAETNGHPSPERRTAQRRSGHLVPVLIADSDPAAPPREGWVLDRSAGGVRLLVDEELPEGTQLNVRPTASSDRFRWIRVEVKSCRRHNHSWNVGCQFVHKVSWNELRLFG